jgi:glycerol uptake facilitator-like aquaporin
MPSKLPDAINPLVRWEFMLEYVFCLIIFLITFVEIVKSNKTKIKFFKLYISLWVVFFIMTFMGLFDYAISSSVAYTVLFVAVLLMLIFIKVKRLKQ